MTGFDVFILFRQSKIIIIERECIYFYGNISSFKNAETVMIAATE